MKFLNNQKYLYLKINNTEKSICMNTICSLSKIGEILLKQRKITPEQLSEALKLQSANNKKLGEILIQKKSKEKNISLKRQLREHAPYH